MRIELLDTYGILRIKTTEFLFDLEDLPLIKGRDSWYCDKDGYLVSSYFYNGVRRFVRFHRLVMHAKPGQCVDHINKNKADNRKKNLRCCERSENDRNRSLYSCNTSGVAGVYFDKERKKWVASITYNHKKVYLGRYAVKEEAILNVPLKAPGVRFADEGVIIFDLKQATDMNQPNACTETGLCLIPTPAYPFVEMPSGYFAS